MVVPRVAVKMPSVPAPKLKLVEKRFVELAVVAKKFVVVADVPVAFTKVKFWSVELPFTRRVESVASPFPKIVPVLKEVAKRLVELAIVAKKLVEVAFVVVEFPVTVMSDGNT